MDRARNNMKAKFALMHTERYQAQKKKRMANLKKIRQTRAIDCARDYLVIANSVSGKDRIDSRIKVITKDGRKADVSKDK